MLWNSLDRKFAWSRAALLICSASVASLGAACTTTEPAKDSEELNEDEDQASTDDEGGDESEGEGTPGKRDAGKADGGRRDGGSIDAGKGRDGGAPSDESPDAGGATGDKSLWCAAREVFQDTCGSCHGKTTAAGAPMALVDYADFTGNAPVTRGKKVWEVVHERVHDTKRPMPPNGGLKPAQLAAIDAWVEAGAEAGDDPTCASSSKPDEEKPAVQWPPPGSDKCYRITVDQDGKGQKQRVAPGAEPHPQVILDAPWGNEDVQAVGTRPITDNAKVLHHWILYQATGFSFITGWAPGQDESELEELPKDVGVYLPKGPRSLRLDMHYNNRQGTKEEIDASGVEICVTKPRKYAATTFMGFGNFLISLPPGKKTDVVGRCNVVAKQPVYLLSQSPHAHELAYHMKLEVKRGTEVIKLHDGPFAFDAQIATPLGKPFELKTGDQVITTCQFENTTNRTVTFGENTGNEMCFNFAVYYPMGALSCGLGF